LREQSLGESMSSLLLEYDITPEEAMSILKATSILKTAVIDNWKEKAIAREFKEFVWLWESAYEALDRLEHGQLPDVLAELSGLSLDNIKRLWSMIPERQREKVVRDIKREIAEVGLTDFLPIVASVVILLPVKGKAGTEAAKLILLKAYDFMNGGTSFDDLMNAIGQLPAIKESQTTYERFRKGAALGKYLNKVELMRLLTKHFITALENALPYHALPYYK